MQQVPVPKTLDVEVVERHLSELWLKTAGQGDPESAVLRARVANLLVYVSDRALLGEINEMTQDVTETHPSRVLVVLGEPEAADVDIEMFVNTLCQTDKRTGAQRLCGEVIALNARGKFTVELPSAALPLMVSDLTTFLWWRNSFQLNDKIFAALANASDRLVIDCDEFPNPLDNLAETHKLFHQTAFEHLGVSDLNWSRLTLWRGLMADFYDVPAYQPLLDEIDQVRIDYVAPASEPNTIAPQALLLTGWLANCLGWQLQGAKEQTKPEIARFTFSRNQQQIDVELNRIPTAGRKPGRLVEVRLDNTNAGTSFRVKRSDDQAHILAEANMGADTHRGRVLPVRNRSLAQLLSREMEILVNDNLYQQALAIAVGLINSQNQ